MKYCPITYEIIAPDKLYSQRGLRLLSPQLKNLNILNLTADEQRIETLNNIGQLAISGVQAKLNARLKIKTGCLEIVDQNANYILKPQSDTYPELPENEAISMSLAQTIDLLVPTHGLLYSKDKSMTYFIKRFDRISYNKKLATEDFAQLMGIYRHNKYESTMEKLITIIENFCTFPKIEFVKLFKLTIFNFLIGNEEMCLKNFSLINQNNKITLSPVYDLLNTTIIQENPQQELALSLNGKKNNLTSNDFLNYFAEKCLGLNQNVIMQTMQNIQQAIPKWQKLIARSFLSPSMQTKYLALLAERCERLKIIGSRQRSI